ncbi:MAG: FG-GAP repeat protein [Ignavibacteria bacterium]|nr:FG-GAP repeat protein [Ignavibacteria bacterium]
MNNIADDILYAADIYYGFSVSSAEDINGDGYSDVIVGAYGYNSNRGRAYIYINSVKKPKLVNPVNNSINNPLTVNFKWKKLSSTMYFILKVATDLAFNNTIVNDTIYVDTSKTIGGFQYSKKYYWKVRAKDTSGTMFESTVWNFTTIFPIRINLKVLMEGMYYPVFNIMTKSDSVKVYLRRAASLIH